MRQAEDITRLIERAKIKLDPEVRRAFHDELVNELEEHRAESSRVPYSIRWRLIMNSAIALCAAGIIVFVGVMGFLEPSDPVAFLSDSISAKWGETKDVPANDTVIRQGKLTLLAGFAEITFNGGAVVVVEGPADIELLTGDNLFVYSGKVYVVVPQEAVGFIVETPCANIVDLGTEFGVSVAVDGSCELHVCKGNVSLMTQAGGAMVSQVLKKGEAVSVGLTNGKIQNIQFGQNIFVREIDSEGGIIFRGEGGGGDLDLCALGGVVIVESGSCFFESCFVVGGEIAKFFLYCYYV